MFRTDNGKEFVNKDLDTYFANKCIIHQFTCPYTSQQNGVAKRKHKHLLEVVRSLKFQSSFPYKFCGDCVLSTCYIINLLPSSILKFETPYQLL